VIAVSDGVAERARALGARNVEVIANGVDTAQFQPVASSEKTEPYFVYTGTMSEWQGCEVFVQAMALVREKHPTAKLRFFGQGSAEPALRKLAAEVAADSVEFGGVVPPADAARWISGASGALVSIVPGKGYDFAKPTKIYAAAACGTPVLFAGVGASAELIEENKLGSVAAYDAKDVAATMIRMLDGERPDSAHLVEWVRDNASLATTGKLAAAWITTTAN
jgi:glycosyltransferase involved in cell wall biosynthesis